MTNKSNPFAGIDDAPPSLGGQYILPGLHQLRVKECKLVDSQKKNTVMFVAAFEVLESDNEDMKVGSERSWVANFAHASAMSNVKHFIAAAAECEFDEVTEELANGAVHESNPLEDAIVSCEAFIVKTRAGGDFTKHKWESDKVVKPQSEDAA